MSKILGLLTFILPTVSLMGANYKVPANSETVTLGLFTLNKPPVVTVRSGDIVTLETWNSCLHVMLYNKTSPADVAKFYQENDIQKRRGMHSLTGPVYVEDAEPGDVLEIRVLDIKLNDFGYNFLSPSQGIFDNFSKPQIKYFKFDKKHNTTEFLPGICLPLKPFPGIIAVAPPLDWPEEWPVGIATPLAQPVAGEFNSVPPGPFAGNLDQPELQAGSILFVPVFQKGGLVWTGDSHAMQSNGEIDVTALETSYEGITFQFIVRKDLRAEGVFDKTKRKGGNVFTWPIIENATHWMIVGLHTDLLEAMKLASLNAIDFLVRMQGFTREESYQFLSMVGDFEIAEAVNMIKNVTVHLPKKVFQQKGRTTSLCTGGAFPLKQPKLNPKPRCVPQEGILIK
ncbi:MAG TPA: acetamidase/formamidase family protein [Chlamydiales bacterium]|jgi:acetamidase/formamidase|nr:acetamidase/formamidase family protein [Chlamydiales bacterium]